MKRPRSSVLRVRTVAFIAALGLLWAAVASGAAGASVAKAEQATIQLALQDIANAFFLPFIQEFEKANPNIKVEVAQYPQAQYAQVTRNQIAAGNPPDVMISNSGYAGQGIGVRTLGDANILEDLSKESWAKKLPDQYRISVAEGKKVFAPILGLSVIPVWYNQKVLDDNALKVPTTYKELLDFCGAVAGKNITPITLAGGFTVALGMFINSLGATTVASSEPDFIQKLLDGKATFAGSKGWKTALNRFVEMNKKGCFGKDPIAQGFTDSQAKLATGEAAAFVFAGGGGGTLFDGIKKVNPAVDITYTMFPATKATDSRLASTPGFTPVVLKGSDEKKAAKKFVAFIAKDQNAIATASGNVPVAGAIQAAFSDLAPAIQAGNAALFGDSLYPSTAVTTAIQVAAQDLLLGRRSVDDALASLDAALAQP